MIKIYTLKDFNVYKVNNKYLIIPENKDIKTYWDLSNKQKDIIDQLIWRIRFIYEESSNDVVDWYFHIYSRDNRLVYELNPII